MPRFLPLALVTLLALAFAGLAAAATDGPDGGGYRYIDNAEQNGPIFAYEDISASGTLVDFGGYDDDGVSVAPIALGFSFTFYGNAYEQATISTNGNLQFATAIDTVGQGSVPVTGNNPPWGPTVFVFGDDLDPGSCGAVSYETRGTTPAQRFIVQWDVCAFGTPNDNIACAGSFQIILFEGTDHILMQYADTTFSEPSPEACNGNNPNPHDNGADDAAVGVQPDESDGLGYSSDMPNITAGLAICFYHDPAGALTEGFCGSTNDADEVCDFTIDKTNDLPEPTAVAAGDTFTWTLTVTWDRDCDDVFFDVTDDLPDGFEVLAVTAVPGDTESPGVLTCNNADPVLCDDAMTGADAGQAAVEIEVTVSEEACGAVDNEAVVTPVTTAEAPATGDSDSDSVALSVECDGDGEASLTVAKSCPFGAGLSGFTVSVADADGDEVASDAISCGESVSFDLPAGDYTLSELLNAADALAFATTIACGDDFVLGASAAVSLEAGEEVTCVVINALGVSPLILNLLINNTNTNEIDIDNTNTNNNANANDNSNNNENTNDNENTNGNTNEQDQTNDQTQDNANDQTNNITSSPQVNIDFGE
jgi:hypothetical protein